MLRRILFALLVVAVIGAAAWALWPRPIAVETAVIDRRDIVVTVEESGKARIREIFTVSAPVAGELTRVTIHPGDAVAAGETVLASIQPVGPSLLDERTRRIAEAARDGAAAAVAMAEAQLEQAQTALQFSNTDYERTSKLAQAGLVSEQMYQRASLENATAGKQVTAAEAALNMRRRELQSAEAALIEGNEDSSVEASCCVEVRAPITGTVLTVSTESEQVVQPGTPLMDLGDPADLEIVVEVLSTDAVRIATGAAAEISGWGGPALAAEVERIDPVAVTKVSALGIEEQRTTVVLRLLGDSAAWERLGHGFRVVSAIVVWQGNDVVAVPTSALFRTGSDWAVFVVDGNAARTRIVELGQRNADFAEVLSGLAPGDAVIVHPADTITDGREVAAAAPVVAD